MDITFIGISFMVIAFFFPNQQNRIVCHSVIHESFTYYTVFPYPNVSHGNDTHVLVFSVSYTLISVVLLLYSTCVGTTRPFPRNFYRPQRSCKGYVFTGVCLSTGGGWCLLPGGAPGRGVPAPREPHPGGGACSRELPGLGGACSQGCACSGGGGAWSGGCLLGGYGGERPPADGCCGGRYASYWNVFLLSGTFSLLKSVTTRGYESPYWEVTTICKVLIFAESFLQQLVSYMLHQVGK